MEAPYDVCLLSISRSISASPQLQDEVRREGGRVRGGDCKWGEREGRTGHGLDMEWGWGRLWRGVAWRVVMVR